MKNAISLAPTFPGVGIGEIDIYKNTCSDKIYIYVNLFKLKALYIQYETLKNTVSCTIVSSILINKAFLFLINKFIE